jgi:hypothetical protein
MLRIRLLFCVLMAFSGMLFAASPALSIFSSSHSGQTTNQTTMSESPIACNLTALNAEQRKRHTALSKELRTNVKDIKELPDGYALQLPSDEATVQATAEWIVLERRCCPFLKFGMEVGREGGPLVLRLTGREGVKRFLKLEFRLP